MHEAGYKSVTFSADLLGTLVDSGKMKKNESQISSQPRDYRFTFNVDLVGTVADSGKMNKIKARNPNSLGIIVLPILLTF